VKLSLKTFRYPPYLLEIHLLNTVVLDASHGTHTHFKQIDTYNENLQGENLKRMPDKRKPYSVRYLIHWDQRLDPYEVASAELSY
jgi:hypothetical protein